MTVSRFKILQLEINEWKVPSLAARGLNEHVFTVHRSIRTDSHQQQVSARVDRTKVAQQG